MYPVLSFLKRFCIARAPVTGVFVIDRTSDLVNPKEQGLAERIGLGWPMRCLGHSVSRMTMVSHVSFEMEVLTDDRGVPGLVVPRQFSKRSRGRTDIWEVGVSRNGN